MCSFIFSRTLSAVSDAILDTANRYARHRGPDGTTVRRMVDRDGRHLTFLHNLLDISGQTFIQPVSAGFEGAQITALFNGEIYNYRELGAFESDTECIIPTYQRHRERTPELLDGEFSIIIYDATDHSLRIFADPFLTKPLYIGESENFAEFAVATCSSSLTALGFTKVYMAEPNSAYHVMFRSDACTVTKTVPLWQFCINQHKNTYAQWDKAFLDSVRKRALHGTHRPMVFLSSGYDSGAICQALNLLGVEYDSFSILAGEERGLLESRIKINKAHSCRQAYRIRGLSAADVVCMAEDITQNVEPFVYQHEDTQGIVVPVQSDGGAIGVDFIGHLAKRKKKHVNLSGAGADEIMSDYGFNGTKFYPHSEFGGLFPENLEHFFPWRKFYGDTQRSYLFKDEYILGRHGIEGRYPYLDRSLVQEFLWLKASLKNRTYKAPIEQFLVKHRYPFEPLKKRGFAPFAPVKCETVIKRLARRFLRSRILGV
jgi:asparagine synthetase B (glutamine-hydrolysing)